MSSHGRRIQAKDKLSSQDEQQHHIGPKEAQARDNQIMEACT